MKKLEYIGPSILSDEQMDMLSFIMMLLNYSDCCYEIIISKTEEKVIMHITPSTPEFKQDIIDNLLYIVKVMKIKIIFSKSLAISHIISLEILF